MLRIVSLFLGITALDAAQTTPAWTFDGASHPELIPVGTVTFKQPGPRRPDYPRFEQTNEAVTFDGKGSHLVVKDTGENSIFDFKNGDALTLEAWVKPDGLRKGENAYVIGKGRDDPKSATPSNQNWALRLRVLYDTACLNFLFASPSGKGIQWHRWTTPTGLANDGRWHHVAVRYEFGKPESIGGWIDGKPMKGSWDMDGPTADAPFVDNAPVWIGSSMGGLANS
ncbi:MAG: LamG-like jellyroll fold domain-containing protein, partial [Verrucomicrobiota bacterium]